MSIIYGAPWASSKPKDQGDIFSNLMQMYADQYSGRISPEEYGGVQGGGAIGSLIGSIWGPIGKMAGKMGGQHLGGNIGRLMAGGDPKAILLDQFVTGPIFGRAGLGMLMPGGALSGLMGGGKGGGGGLGGLMGLLGRGRGGGLMSAGPEGLQELLGMFGG